MAGNHYIPQFILRHFCTDNLITYCDLKKQKIELRNTKSVFSEKGYYPDVLERSLCEKIELQFASLLNGKILKSHKRLNLSADEILILKKFLLTTVFRYKTNEQVESENYPDLSKSEFNSLGGDFFENLNKILECKTLEDMFNYADLDNESTNIKLFSYLKDILYSYTVIVSSKRCDEDFLIPDKGYASYEGPIKVKKLTATLDLAKKTNDPLLFQIASMLTPHDYSVFPLSSNLAILTMSPFFKLCLKGSPYKIKFPDDQPTLSDVLGFGNGGIIEAPKIRQQSEKVREYILEIQHLESKDVIFLNSLLISNSDQYFACADICRIQDTVDQLVDNNELSFLKSDMKSLRP
jgi:hypothetical protein